MELKFSIIGYAVIVVFYLITGTFLMFFWVRRHRYRWIKPALAVAVPVVLVLPWAEELWIAWNFAKLCEGAGVHVTRKVQVDGFFNSTTTGPARPGVISDPRRIASYEGKGYRFIERKAGYGPDAKVSHVEKDDEGQWSVTILDAPEARYHFRFSDPRQEVPIKWKIEMVEKQILDSENAEIIAKDNVFIRYPNAIEWQWIRFFGLGIQICRGPLDEPEKQKRIGQLFKYVFIPKN